MKDLLDVLKSLSKKEEEIQSLFGDCDFFSGEISLLAEIIMEQNGIPKDNEIIFSNIMEYGWGNLSKEKLKKCFIKYK